MPCCCSATSAPRVRSVCTCAASSAWTVTWAGHGPDGAGFSARHPYARDLDLFGPGSLFQLLTRRVPRPAKRRWPTGCGALRTTDEILARQQAVAELRGRSRFPRGSGRSRRRGARWPHRRARIDGRMPALGLPAIAGVLAGLSAAGAATTVACSRRPRCRSAGRAPARLAGRARSALVACLARVGSSRLLSRIEAAVRSTSACSVELLARRRARDVRIAAGSQRIRAAARRRRTARCHRLASSGCSRSIVGARLAATTRCSRRLAPLLLVRSQAAVAIDRWHARQRAGTGVVAGRASASSRRSAALPTFAYEHPHRSLPVDRGRWPALRGRRRSRIRSSSDQVAVPNDVRLGGDATARALVSGSNMSGKSTLLRAVGMQRRARAGGRAGRARRR